MAEVGVILPQRAALKSGFSGRHRREVGYVDRIRKPIVTASLISSDIIAAMAAASLGRALTTLTSIELPSGEDLSVALLILIFLCLRLYTGYGPSPYERFRLRAIGIVSFTAVDLLIHLRVRQPGVCLLACSCEAFFLLMFGHYLEAITRNLLIRVGLWGASAVLVGCSETNRELACQLMHEPALGLTPIGFIETPRDGAVHKSALPLPLIGTTADLHRICRHVEFAIYGSASELSALASDPNSSFASCRLLLVEDVQNLQSLWLRTRMLGAAIGIEIRRDLCLRHNQLLKRVIDILFAIPIALLVCPLVGVLAVVIKFVDPGPAFYVQERIGRNAKPLRMFKLRTMYADAERRLEEHLNSEPQARAEWQRRFKLSRDPRVLPFIGNFMRRTSLDELPQFWNVIRGDMSLVGPRPFPAYHMKSFDDEFQAIRVSVAPGITGMWQVSSRSNGDLQVQRAQDLFYIRNWSIWLDIYVLLQTVPAVLSGKGAR
jgi:Undecaprenyl-phosphate galactose phosphotransferase WbaP